MNCRNVLKQLPLMVGNDLSESKTKAVAAHLETCPHCQKEYHIYMSTRRAAKEHLKRQQEGWSNDDWHSIMDSALNTLHHKQTATANKRAHSPSHYYPSLKSWGYGLAMAALILMVLLLNQHRFQQQPLNQPGPNSPPQQDKVEVTFVAKETGLKINWVYDRNFDYDGAINTTKNSIKN